MKVNSDIIAGGNLPDPVVFANVLCGIAKMLGIHKRELKWTLDTTVEGGQHLNFGFPSNHSFDSYGLNQRCAINLVFRPDNTIQVLCVAPSWRFVHYGLSVKEAVNVCLHYFFRESEKFKVHEVKWKPADTTDIGNVNFFTINYLTKLCHNNTSTH